MFHEDWYNEDQCQFLRRLVQEVKPLTGSIIEIGCWEGKSTSHIARECFPEIVICNDTWLGNVEESKVTGEKHCTEVILETRDVFSIFKSNMNILTEKNYTIVQRDCLEWLPEYNEPIKFLHIDASHEYESVYKTIQFALPKMVPGGIICGDDFSTSSLARTDLNGGVERAVRESFPTFGLNPSRSLWYWINR